MKLLLDEMNAFLGDGQVDPGRPAFRELLGEVTAHYRRGERVSVDCLSDVSPKLAEFALVKLGDLAEGERALSCPRDPLKCNRSAWEDRRATRAVVVCKGHGRCRYARAKWKARRPFWASRKEGL